MKELDPKAFIALTVAGIINAFGVTIFLFPVNLKSYSMTSATNLVDAIFLRKLKL